MEINVKDFLPVVEDFFHEEFNVSTASARRIEFRRNLHIMPIGEALFRVLPWKMQSRIRGTEHDIWNTEDPFHIMMTLSYLSKHKE